MPKKGEPAYNQQKTTLLKPERLHLRTTHVSCPVDITFLAKIQAASISDSFIMEIQHRQLNHPEESSQFKIEDHLLYFKKCLYVAGDFRLPILQARYDFSVVGHFGFNKTLELITHNF